LECIKAVRGAGARTVREIASRCNTSPATVSRYMKILRQSGQVEVGGVEGEGVRVSHAEGFREVYRALGQEYADIIRMVTERTGWFTEALVNIGWWSVLAAFQYARVEPKDIPRKIEQYKDSEAFVKDVTNYLTAMIQAGSDAVNTITNLQREAERYRNVAKVLAGIVKGLRLQLRNTTQRLEVAQALLLRYDLLEEYANAIAQLAIVESLISTSAYKTKTGS